MSGAVHHQRRLSFRREVISYDSRPPTVTSYHDRSLVAGHDFIREDHGIRAVGEVNASRLRSGDHVIDDLRGTIRQLDSGLKEFAVVRPDPKALQAAGAHVLARDRDTV